MKSGIVSILNLKNGVGCSCLAWNIAHTLKLNLYQHDKAMHHIYNEQRKKILEYNAHSMLDCTIDTSFISKKEFNSGIYDLGSDFNYAHMKKIIIKSEVVVIPCELGHETLIKTIATIRAVSDLNKTAKIFVVINKLLPLSDSEREKKYTNDAIDFILKSAKIKVDFYFMRHSFALFRFLNIGFFFLDNYIYSKETINKPITEPFELLQHTRWKSIDTMYNQGKKEIQIKDSTFYDEHRQKFNTFITKQPFEEIINGSFLFKNQRAIKDMLILTTHIKRVLDK